MKQNPVCTLPLQFHSGLTVCIDPPKDGDCQFAAVAYLLFHQLQLKLSHVDIRAEAIKYLSDDNALLLDGTRYDFEQYLLQQPKHSYMKNMSRQGTFGDHVTLVAISCVYKVQFVVLSTLGESATSIISPNVNSSYDEALPTLVLGHIAEGQGSHYVGLLPDNPETVINIIHKRASFQLTGPSVHVLSPNIPTSSQSEPQTSFSDMHRPLPPVADLGLKNDGPKQPHLTLFPKTMFGKQNRSFSINYYDNYPWVEYSVQHDAVFCFACRHFHTDRRFVEELFISKGLKDWKKLAEKLSKHSGAQSHISHMQKWLAFKSTDATGSIAMQLSESHMADVQKNRRYLAMVCDVVKLLAKLGLPFRGHAEGKQSNSKGNFLEICDFLSTYVESFRQMQENYFNCSSPDFQNEIINICGAAVRNEIVDAVRRAGFFTIMADEARSAKTEQLSLCLRYVDGLYVKERFVCFVDCSSSRDAEGITKVITDCLNQLKLKDVPIVGQSYDGAAVMSGHVSGVQTRMRVDYPVAIYFHCLAHKLNLVLVYACRVNRMAVGFFNTIEQLYNFFSNPGSHDIFLKIQKTLGLNPTEIGQLSDTRWACRWKSVEAVKTNYAAIVKSLVELSDPVLTNCSAEAAGLSLHIQKSDFVVALFIFEEFLRIIHVAHKALQCSTITLGRAGDVVERLTTNFRNRRSKKGFVVLYHHAEELCKLHKIEIPPIPKPTITCDPVPVLQGTGASRVQRTVKTTSSLRDFLVTTTLGQRECIDGSSGSTDANNSNVPTYPLWYNQLYLPVCDALIGQLELRFNKDSLALAKSVDALLHCKKDGIKPLVDTYAKTINVNPQLLASEMDLFSSTDREITIDLIQNELAEDAYPQYYKMVQLALTLPVGSATAERSFSAMRRIRNWLRSTMGQERFSSLALLNIECDLTAELVPEDLVLMYANSGTRRIQLH